MGLSSSKQTQKYTPSPQQLGAANTLTGVYNASQPATQAITDQFTGLMPGQLATVNAANGAQQQAAGYYGDVLGGKYLTGNPQLQSIIDASNADIRDQTNGSFGMAGRTGSPGNQYALAKAIGQNESSLRYNDYNTQMNRMDSAASSASSMGHQSLADFLNLGTTAAGLPLSQAEGYASGIGSLGIGGTTTTTSSPGLGQILMQIAASAASAASKGG